MTIFEILWAVYLDGYSLQHWFSIFWMVSLNGAVLMTAISWLVRKLEE